MKIGGKKLFRMLMAILVAMLIGFLLGPKHLHSQYAKGSFLYFRYIPPVIYNDGISSMTVEVATTGNDIVEVRLRSWKVDFGPMYDDGTHGDRVANDGIYTRDNVTSQGMATRMWFGGTHSIHGLYVEITKSSGEKERHGLASFGIVDKSQRFPSVKLGDGLYATEYAFFIVDKKGEIFPGFPLTEIWCGKTNFAAYQKLYSVFPDVFDFIVVMPSGTLFDPDDYGERTPYYVAAKNDVQHIGVPIFDETAKFGSAGRLRGVIYHSFGCGAILDHEIGHAWGFLLGHDLGLIEDYYEGARYGHWADNTDIGGQVGAFLFTDETFGQLKSNEDGTFRLLDGDEIQEKTFPYSKLALYAMGLIPPEEVPPVHILINPDYSDLNRITAERVDTITIEQIMAAEGGERIPPYEESQKDFNIAFIAVSDREFTPAEMAFFSLIAKFFSSKSEGEHYLTPFYTATGGRATLNARLPVEIPTPVPTDTPTPVPTDTPTPVPTETPTLVPTETPTPMPTDTPTPVPPTATPTIEMPSPTPIEVAVATPKPTPTALPKPAEARKFCPICPLTIALPAFLPAVAIMMRRRGWNANG